MEPGKKIIIVGGLSAGPSAAARARRLDERAEILLFESSDHISYATCGIPYALSGVIPSRDKLLVVKPELLEKRFRIQMHLGEAVEAIDPAGKTVRTAKGSYPYDVLVYAAGATSIVPRIEGLEGAVNASSVRTLADFDRMMEKEKGLASASHVTVLGAGLIGVEVAENLRHAGKRVTVLEGSGQALPPWDADFGILAQKALEAGGVEVKTGVMVKQVHRDGERIRAVVLPDGSRLDTDYLILSVGIRPHTALLTQHGAKALGNGALVVNERMETSLPGIYAAGDCAAVTNRQTGAADWFPLGTHSNKAGRVAGENAAGGDARYGGAYGTAIVKIFKTTLARTGINAKRAAALGLAAKQTWISAGATPSYYPDSKPLSVSLTWNPADGRLLGAELAGEAGADKRIDVLATAVYAGLTVEQLGDLDLAYAPPFSPAKDPVIVAAYSAVNDRRGLVAPILPLELSQRLASGLGNAVLLDVRGKAEVAKSGVIQGAICLELDALRQTLTRLDPSKETIVYCAKGLRGYLAGRILAQNGFASVRNLAGGFDQWKALGLPSAPMEQAAA
ncbi:MAG: FAD-dependent oxidoreductase [Spirochaetes bacterium]|nr:FAD-dependent oxidoreductase [Spirochaetota bacterium]